MTSVRNIRRWQEGRVDRTEEHFELRYGSAKDRCWNEWLPIAVVGPPVTGMVSVQFLVERADPRNTGAISDVEREIQFYLIDKREYNPWEYAQHHCGTSANAYSQVHWSFFQPGKQLQVRERAEMKPTAGKKGSR
jgi:hypothetical protein